MANYVENMVIVPRKVYKDKFQLKNAEKYEYYNFDKLKKPQEHGLGFDIYGYGEGSELKEFVEREDGRIEMHFDTKWKYPIRLILRLLEEYKSSEVEWYCCKEEAVYVSKFVWDEETGRVQEETFYLDSNLEYLRWEDPEEDTEEQRLYGYVWGFHPERRQGWQKVSSDDLLARYSNGSAIDDILLEKAFEWVTVQNDEFVLKICIEWWFSELFYDFDEDSEGKSSWIPVSWILYGKNGFSLEEKAYEGYRQKILREDEIREVYQKMAELITGEMTEVTELELEAPTFKFRFLPGKEPKIEVTVEYLADEALELVFKGKEMMPLVRAFEDAREGYFYYDGENETAAGRVKFRRIVG